MTALALATYIVSRNEGETYPVKQYSASHYFHNLAFTQAGVSGCIPHKIPEDMQNT